MMSCGMHGIRAYLILGCVDLRLHQGFHGNRALSGSPLGRFKVLR
jgi:hypothetical protein